jgi:thermitase
MHRIAGAMLVVVLAGLCLAATASASYDAHTVLVKFAPQTTAAQRAALGASDVAGSIDGLGVKVVRVADPRAAVAALNRSPLVQYAELNRTLTALATPNDPRYAEEYGLDKIDAPEGWDAAGLGTFPNSGGALVGIVDTGIRATHEDLAGKVAFCAKSQGILPILSGSIQEGSCADDNGHGSHTSGTITANTNNGKGVAGVAFNSKLAVCKALGGPLGQGSTADVANCIVWAHDKGAKVISMSLGGGDSTTLHNAVQTAWAGGGAGGTVLVAAAGNDGDATINYPAGYAEVVSVAATDSADARASFSNANADVEIAGPGVDVLSTYNSSDTSYTTLSGTSMATPHVAGATAIIWDKYPTATASAIRSKLDAAVDDLGAPGRDSTFGFGRVNLAKAASQ